MQADGHAKEQRFIIVTGPGRSGTSAVGRVLHESGVTMGRSFDAPSSFNPLGFFEELPVCDLNERIMADCGMKGLEHWPARDVALAKAARYGREMDGLAGDPSIQGWKDPRFCITLEAWLPHLPCAPTVVVCLRSPEAFVHSVVSIFGLSRRETLERWWANHLRRVLDVIRGYRLEATCVVYEELVERPAEAVAALSSFIGRPLDPAFVEPGLRQFGHSVPPRHAALFAEVRSLGG